MLESLQLFADKPLLIIIFCFPVIMCYLFFHYAVKFKNTNAHVCQLDGKLDAMNNDLRRYKAKVSEMTTDLQKYQKRIAGLETELLKSEGRIKHLEQEITARDKLINNLKKRIAELEGKKTRTRRRQ